MAEHGAMKLRSGEWAVLRGTKRDLAADLRLTELFQMFNQLTRGERIPHAERLRNRRARDGWRAAIRMIIYGSAGLMTACCVCLTPHAGRRLAPPLVLSQGSARRCAPRRPRYRR